METAKFGPSSKNLDVRPPLHSNLRHLLVLLKESLLCLSPGGSDQPCSLLLGFSFRLEAHQLAKTRGLLDHGQCSGCRSWSSDPEVSLESANFFALRDIQLISRDKPGTRAQRLRFLLHLSLVLRERLAADTRNRRCDWGTVTEM